MNRNTFFLLLVILTVSCEKKDPIPIERNHPPRVGLQIETSYQEEGIFTEKDILFTTLLLDSNEREKLYTRWDFNGDSEWDTDWLEERRYGRTTYERGNTYTYQFLPSDTGEKMAKVEVKDQHGLLDADSTLFLVEKLTGEFENKAPEFRSAVPTKNHGSLIPYGVKMVWEFNDPERNQMTYEVLIYPNGQTEPVQHLTDIEEEQVIVDLEPNMTYTWQVNATDEWGAATQGESQEFKTCTIVKPCPDKPVVYDSEGNEYPTVEICGTCWMAKNMNNLKPDSGWVGRPTKYCRDDDSTNCQEEGGYYIALSYVFGPQKTKSICPDGFHIPTSFEWSKVLAPQNRKHMIPGGKVGLNLEIMGHMQPRSSSPHYFGERGYYWMSPIEKRDSRLVLFGEGINQYHTDRSGMLAPIRCVAD